MKTAISLPDSTFDAVSRRAAELGISRSEFFVVAARRYLAALDERSRTAQIDEALEAAQGDDSGTAAATAGRRRVATAADW